MATNFELALVDHNKSNAMSGDECCLASIVESSLLTPRNSRYGRSPVKYGHGYGVLLLLKLHDHVEAWPVPIDRQAS